MEGNEELFYANCAYIVYQMCLALCLNKLKTYPKIKLNFFSYRTIDFTLYLPFYTIGIPTVTYFHFVVFINSRTRERSTLLLLSIFIIASPLNQFYFFTTFHFTFALSTYILVHIYICNNFFIFSFLHLHFHYITFAFYAAPKRTHLTLRSSHFSTFHNSCVAFFVYAN